MREVFSQRSKLFQRRDEWEEIGLGTAVLLESPSQVRFVLKIVCSIIVMGALRTVHSSRAGNDEASRLCRWRTKSSAARD